MKQLIVMIAMIMVGITIAGLVSQFGDKAIDLSKSAQTKLDAANIVTVPNINK